MRKFNIIGHRGFGPTDNGGGDHPYPENTLKAFKHALDGGADGIELDVFLTSDGKAVAIHDQRLHEHVIPQQFAAASQKPVGQHTYAELQSFDLKQGQKIPLLRDIFELAGEYTGQRIINLDVKDINSVGPILDETKKMHDSLRPHHIVVSSYNWDILRAFRKQDTTINLVPAVKSALLFGAENVEKGTYRPLSDVYQKDFEIPLIALHKEIGAYAFDCAISDFTPALIDLARSQGVGLQLSTGNERVNADNTNYTILSQLRNSTEAGIPFVICKVDEPSNVMKKMKLL